MDGDATPFVDIPTPTYTTLHLEWINQSSHVVQPRRENSLHFQVGDQSWRQRIDTTISHTHTFSTCSFCHTFTLLDCTVLAWRLSNLHTVVSSWPLSVLVAWPKLTALQYVCMWLAQSKRAIEMAGAGSLYFALCPSLSNSDCSQLLSFFLFLSYAGLALMASPLCLIQPLFHSCPAMSSCLPSSLNEVK